MNKFIEPKFKVIKKDLENNYVEFEIQPLVQGFGITIGNSLRRVLLSVVPGISIFAFKIKDVMQEFQTLPGCIENVLQINLNIQKIKIKVEPNIYNENEIIDLHLKINKEGVVKAKDIETPVGITIINPELKLFEMTKSNEVEIDFKAKQGYGFSTFEENRDLIDEVGWISMTSNFSPVEKVSMITDEIKLGEKSVLEKVILGIKTNGTISPIDTLSIASEILYKHFEFIKDLAPTKFEEFKFLNPKDEVEKKVEDVEITELDFSERTYNALSAVGITKVSQLKEKTLSELRRIKNIGDKSVSEIDEKLKNECKITLKS